MEQIIEMPDGITYLSTLSGGLDSALITYLIMKLKPNSKMVLSSFCLQHQQNHNFDTVKKIMNYLDYTFPFRIIDHRIGFVRDIEHAKNGGRAKQTRELLQQYDIQGIISGFTINPPELMIEGRDETRDAPREWRSMNQHGIYHYQPFINKDKRYIAELYQQYQLQELADLTVSCEAEQPPRPCKKCWWCKEKYWAFGFY